MGVIVVAFVYRDAGYTFRFTSGVEGKHMRGSAHVSGRAFDCGTKGVSAPNELAMKMKAALGDDFDVILEAVDTPHEHIHVEYDPKEPL